MYCLDEDDSEYWVTTMNIKYLQKLLSRIEEIKIIVHDNNPVHIPGGFKEISWNENVGVIKKQDVVLICLVPYT